MRKNLPQFLAVLIMAHLCVLVAGTTNLLSASPQETSPATDQDSQQAGFQVTGRVVRSVDHAGTSIEALFSWDPKDMAEEALADPESNKTRLTTQTDAQGNFSIDFPSELLSKPGIKVQISLTYPGYVARTIESCDPNLLNPENTPVTYQTQRVLNALKQTNLRPGRQFRGRALLPDGSPAANATITSASLAPPYQWKFPDPNYYAGSAKTSANENGEFEILVDSMSNLSVSSEGHAPLLIGNLDDVDDPNNLMLPMGIRPSLQLVDRSGIPIGGAIISLWKQNPYNEHSSPQIFVQTLVTDSQGKLNWQNRPLPPGDYRLQTVHRIADAMDAQGIDLDDSSTWQHLRRSPLDDVVIPLDKTFSVDELHPEFVWRGQETCHVHIQVELDNHNDGKSTFRASGQFNGTRWIGEATTLLESGTYSIAVPKGLQHSQIDGPMAYLKDNEDMNERIGSNFQLGQINEDRDDLHVRVPGHVGLTVVLNGVPFEELSKHRVDISYVHDDLPKDHVYTPAQFDSLTKISTSTTLSGIDKTITCYAIMEHPLILMIRDDGNKVVVQKNLLLTSDNQRVVIDLNALSR